MPRKPWVKLSTSIISSTTWKATRDGEGRSEFLALLVLADENGVVDAVNVSQLALTCYCSSHHKVSMRVSRNLHKLSEIGTICRQADGTIVLPKYKEYQYLVDKRPNHKYRITPSFTPVLPHARAEQSRAEQITTTRKVPDSGESDQSRKAQQKHKQAVVAIWCEWFKSYRHKQYILTAKDRGKIAALAAAYPEPQLPALKAKIIAYMKDHTQERFGWTFAAFEERQNNYSGSAHVEQPIEPDEPQDDAGFLSSARATQ